MKLSELKNLIREESKLCKRGKNYIAARKRAGEKSSAYLSGRGVKVCKGQIKGSDGKKKKSYSNENVAPNHKGKAAPYGSGYEKLKKAVIESLEDWFGKEDWVRIDTQGNISGKCGTMKKGKATTRCLPRAKANAMTKAERKATVAKKIRGGKKGKQFVPVKEQLELSENFIYHTENHTSLYECVFRYGSKGHLQLVNEARDLYNNNQIELSEEDIELINTDLGQFGIFEGERVPLDLPMLDEAKNKPLNKPMRDSSGGKAYKVYVKDPKTGNIKTVRFGSGGLKAKIADPKARKAFAARQKCSAAKDKTKAKYWSCRLPRYAKNLGFKNVPNPSAFW